MARYNEILVGRYNRFLQKFLSMKGPAPTPQLASEMVPSWALFHGAENRYLEGWDRFAVITNVIAAVGNQSAARMRNPAGSNVVAVFEKISIFLGAAGNVAFDGTSTTPPNSDLATVLAVSTSRLDPRGRSAPSLVQSLSNTVAGAPRPNNQFAQLLIPSTSNIDAIVTDIQELPLLPGDSLQLTSSPTNVQLTVSWLWRERFLEDSERA